MRLYGLLAALLAGQPLATPVAAETTAGLSIPSCSATLTAAREYEIGGRLPFAIIEAEPDLSIRGCRFVSFHRTQTPGPAISHIIARYWEHGPDDQPKAVLRADSSLCPEMTGVLKALEKVRAPPPHFEPPGSSAMLGLTRRIVFHGTSLTFRTSSLQQVGDLSNGFSRSEFTTLDFPQSPISKWLKNELPKLEQCWRPGDNEEDYPVETDS
jgi:hypothetical protein